MRQTGTLTILNSAGGDPVAELLVSGDIALATVDGPQAWLILNMLNGRATGTNLTLQRLDLFYQGTGGSADLAGMVGGLSGANAAQNGFVLPGQNADYLLNGCPIGSVNCILILRDPVPVQKPINTVDFIAPRPPIDDPDLYQVLPNVGRQDY